MQFPPGIEKYVNHAERRVTIKSDTLPFIQEHFSYIVETNLGARKSLDFGAYWTWMLNNVRGYWSIQSITVDTERFYFEQRNDAVMFKLKWGG